MAEILMEAKTSSKIIDALGIAGVVVASDLLLSGFVGSGNILSGGAKVVGGLISSGLGKSKAWDIIGAGLLVSGSLDIVNSVVGGRLKSNPLLGDSQGQSQTIYV